MQTQQLLTIIIFILFTLILAISMYKLTDVNRKFTRVKKRYDKLLRGRGELNLEQLLSQQAEDVEYSVNKVKEIEEANDSLQKEIYEKSSNLSSDFNNRINNIEDQFATRIDSLEESFYSKILNLEDSFNNKIDNLDSKQSQGLNSLDEKIDLNTNEIKQKQKEDIDNIVDENEDFKKKLEEDTNNKIKLLSDQLAFAIQKQIFHQYNAFENQTGELSFTLILLDQFNNGIMLTSINARDNSYVYTKEVKNGETEYECSPEEQKALNNLLNHK